jgi:hypothetical protein
VAQLTMKETSAEAADAGYCVNHVLITNGNEVADGRTRWNAAHGPE